MGKLYRGNVSFVTGFDKKGRKDIRLKKDVEGAFNSENVSDMLAKADELSKKHRLPLNTWSFYFPIGRTYTVKEKGEDVEKPLEPVLLADKFGKPKLTMLKPMASRPTPKGKTEKLA